MLQQSTRIGWEGTVTMHAHDTLLLSLFLCVCVASCPVGFYVVSFGRFGLTYSERADRFMLIGQRVLRARQLGRLGSASDT